MRLDVLLPPTPAVIEHLMTQPSQPAAYSAELPPVPDLPPVEAPSAAFIVQLFVIPAVVVLVVICVWLLFGKLAGGERDAMEYVRLIRIVGRSRARPIARRSSSPV